MDSERILHCCRLMTEHLERQPADEVLVYYSAEHSVYGLPDRKDRSAYMPISFCPWCGQRLLSGFSAVVPFNSAPESPPLPPPLPRPTPTQPAPARWRVSS